MTNYHGHMIPADLDIDMLRCFVEVAKTKSFTQAGLNIYLTQSGVSVKIRRLEDRLSAKVFKRGSKNLTLTKEGEMLLTYANRILSVHDEAVNQFASPAIVRKHLKVGVIEYCLPTLLPGVLKRFGSQHPDISVEVQTGMGMDLLPLYEKGKLDLVIAGKDKELDKSDSRVLIEEQLYWIVSSEIESSFHDVIPLVVLPQPCTFRKFATEQLTSMNRKWEIVFTGTSVTSIQIAIQAGMGVAVLPEGAIISGIAQAPSELKLPELPVYPIAVFSNNEKKNDTVELFIKYLEGQTHEQFN